MTKSSTHIVIEQHVQFMYSYYLIEDKVVIIDTFSSFWSLITYWHDRNNWGQASNVCVALKFHSAVELKIFKPNK